MKKFSSAALALVLLSAALPSGKAHAFPGMIRHGYVNCTACHVSPSGGGVLTPYGRELSGEVMSTATRPGEGAALYGAFSDRLPQQLKLGGDVRQIQTYKNNSVLKEDRFFLMQADLSAGWDFSEKWTAVVTAGYYDPEGGSPNHYVIFRPRGAEDPGFSLRAGKFRQTYGINLPEHTIATRRYLNWDEGAETYNLEAAWLRSSWNFFVTAIFGKPESVDQEDGLTIGRIGISETGASARGSVFLADRHELGLSVYAARNDFMRRAVAGPYAVLGFTPRFYLLSELDFQSKKLESQGGAFQHGLFNYQRLTYEPIQGVQIFVSQEMARPEFARASSRLERYGLGLNLFPRPHWEIQLLWQKQRTAPDLSGFGDFAWAMAHFYI